MSHDSNSQRIDRFDSAHRIDEICDNFEKAWKGGQRPRIESYLQLVPTADQSALLTELLPLELELRGGYASHYDLPDYLSRFPDQSDLVESLFTEIPSLFDSPTLRSLAAALTPNEQRGHADSFLAEAEKLASIEFYRDGQYLIRQGDPASFLIVIHDGTVAVTMTDEDGNTRTLDHSGPGEMLGEMALVTSQPRTANVIAEGPVVAAKLSAEQFQQLIRNQPKLSHVLTDLIAQRLGEQQHDALTDKRLDRYRIRRRLGRGGMAVVYEATDETTDQRVALKMMSHALVYNEAALQKFQMEADLIERFDHPNIVSMDRRFEAFHTFFIAMEYCVGTSLDEYLYDHGAMGMEEFRIALSQLASALAYAHAEGVVHRDVKPANVMRLSETEFKLMDFGLAEPLLSAPQSEGELIGTPRYMSPEQRVGDVVDERTDYFALGAVAYEMLTGEPLFDRAQMEEVMREFDQWKPPDFRKLVPDLPLANQLNQLLEVDPNKRKVDLGAFT